VAYRPPSASASSTRHTGFTGALNEILMIAAIIAFLGAIAGFALVRRRDFVAAGPPAAGHQVGPQPLDEPAADAVRA
jgi:hypothetical protein